jgi:peptide/nickel transport system substrate-binding protein
MKKLVGPRPAAAGFAIVIALTLALTTCAKAPAPAKQKEKDTFRIGILDPIYLKHNSNYSAIIPTLITSLIYDPVSQLNCPSSDVKFKDITALERMDISPDGKTCLIKLRKGMLFHNGEEVTSADIAYSVESVPKTKNIYYMPGIIIHILDRYTVRLRAENLVDWHSVMKADILNAKYARHEDNESYDDYFTVGSGPYRFIGYDKVNSIIKLERWDKYWAGPAKYKFVDIQRFYSADAQTMAILEGKIDFIKDISFEDVSMIRKNKDIYVVEATLRSFGTLILNKRKPQLSDRRVRQALSLLIDRENIVKSPRGLNGAGVAADTMFNYAPPYTQPTVAVKYDPAHAIRLLNEAGCVKNGSALLCGGKPLVLELVAQAENQTNALGMLRLIANAWNEAGVSTIIKAVDNSSILKLTDTGNFDVYFANGSDPGSFASAYFNFLNCKNAFYCMDDHEIARNANSLKKLSLSKADRYTFLKSKNLLQASIREDATFLPLYYDRNYAATRGEVIYDETFLLGPLCLSYQARPGLARY